MNRFWHYPTERPTDDNGHYIIMSGAGHIDITDIYGWDSENGEFFGNIHHHVPLDGVYGWISLGEIENYIERERKLSKKI